jgi:cobalt-zinc-cadmium efflux system protein
MSNDDVSDIHHFHIWSLDGEKSVMTAHVELSQDISVSQLKSLKDELRDGLNEFDFVHTTIEIEFANEECRDEQTNLTTI